MRLYLLLSVVILFASCKKSDTSNSNNDCLPIKKENIVGRYRLTTLEEKQDNGTIRNYITEMPACSQDDIYNSMQMEFYTLKQVQLCVVAILIA